VTSLEHLEMRSRVLKPYCLSGIVNVLDRLIANIRSAISATLVITRVEELASHLFNYCPQSAGDDLRVLSVRPAHADEDVPFAALSVLLAASPFTRSICPSNNGLRIWFPD
jgi:hypothetical protein